MQDTYRALGWEERKEEMEGKKGERGKQERGRETRKEEELARRGEEWIIHE